MGAMALHGYSSMELKSRSFTSKEPHVAREPQVADPWARALCVVSAFETNLRLMLRSLLSYFTEPLIINLQVYVTIASFYI
jgi:hypothetical protein